MKKLLLISVTILFSASAMAQKSMSPEMLWNLKRLSAHQVNPQHQSVI